jgi:hypothetical protein
MRTLLNRRIVASLINSLLAAFCTSAAHAQYALDWFTLDGGGGTSAGGTYALSGTLGQPEAGPGLIGGSFAVQGCFWPGVVRVSPEVPPILYIQLSGEGITISWTPATSGFLLEEATDLSSAQWALAPTGNPVTLPVVESSRLYRLRKR